MCDALKELFKEELEERWNDGVKVGISQGISQGVLQGLEVLVCKKIQKQKTLQQIAEELEAEVEEIRPIYNRIKKAMV